MRWPRFSRTSGLWEGLIALVVATLGLIAFARLADTPQLRAQETASLDLRISLRGTRAPGPEVALVLVDDRSLATFGRWPFSRRVFAQAVERLTEVGARVLVFDLLFSEPEQPIPPAVREAAAEAATRLDHPDHQALRDALRRVADDDPDGALAAAVRRSGRVLLAYAFGFDPTSPATLPDNQAYTRFVPTPDQPIFPLQPVSVLPPIDRLTDAAAGLGHVTLAYDRDGAPRYDYLALPYQADFYPSMAVRAVASYRGVPWSEVGLAPGRSVVIGTKADALEIPTDRAMRLLINYRGARGTFPTYSFVDLMTGSVPAEALRDRIVLIGAAAIGINDTFRTPFGSTPVPGVERMANVIDVILRQDFIERPEALAVLEPLLVLALALAGGLLAARAPTRAAALVAVTPPALWAGLAVLALAHGLWLTLVAPVTILMLAMLSASLFRYAVVERESRHVRSAFRHYLAPTMVNELAAHPERLRLGGEIRPMTVLFCDIRDFTRLSEATPPQSLATVMNRFFTPMTEIIQAHHGTVDKFIGDCVMAFWNAPLDDANHASHACAAAMAMLAEIDRLGPRLAAEFPGLPHLRAGIGLNSGPCCVGNFGSRQRFDYSVLGDTVNIASRIESLCKRYNLTFLAGATTRALTPTLPWLLVDEVTVRGHTTPNRLFTLWPGPPERHQALAIAHEHLAILRSDGATDAFQAARTETQALAAPWLSEFYQAL